MEISTEVGIVCSMCVCMIVCTYFQILRGAAEQRERDRVERGWGLVGAIVLKA